MLAAVLTVLSGLSSAAGAAAAMPAAPGVPNIGAAAPVAEAPFDYTASVTLSPEDLKGPKFEETSRQIFAAYLKHEGISGIGASVARGRFEAVLPWNAEFAREHARGGITLSFAEVSVNGEKRFVQASSFNYNGRKVTAYRYKDGLRAASSIFIDGKEAKDADGEPLQFFTKDKETYLKFKAWFEDTLGRPKPKEGE